MTKYDNTYYGPVGQKSDQGTTDKDNQTQGSLTQYVQQPSDQSPSFTGTNDGRYVEIFKGPYGEMKDLPGQKSLIGLDISTLHSKLGASKLVSRFDIPNPGAGKKWTSTSIEVQQLDAGDHCLLKISYEIARTTTDGQFVKDPYTETWQLNWQSYTVTPYAFCTNDPVEDPQVGSDVMEGREEQRAWRQNIEKFMNYSGEGVNKADFEYKNTLKAPYGYQLNYPERLITKKVLEGVSPVYHYPILTHTTTKSKKIHINTSTGNNQQLETQIPETLEVVYPDTIGYGIDHVVDVDGCPYTFNVDYQWVKTGDDLTQVNDKNTNIVNFTRKETFMGVLSADENFYGNTPLSHTNLEGCRWQIGEL